MKNVFKISGVILIASIFLFLIYSCKKDEPTPVSIATAAIAGVTVPVTGATPTATIAATSKYTAMIAWSGSPTTFAGGTVYTATITLTPKTGYTLTGVAANFFTVAGATATNAADSGVVSAVFSATEAQVVAVSAINDTTVLVGATTTKAVTTTPSDATVAAVSGNTEVATVIVADHVVTVTGVSVGTSTITVTSSISGYNSGIATFTVTVTAA
jgi:hypothetical protein